MRQIKEYIETQKNYLESAKQLEATYFNVEHTIEYIKDTRLKHNTDFNLTFFDISRPHLSLSIKHRNNKSDKHPYFYIFNDYITATWNHVGTERVNYQTKEATDYLNILYHYFEQEWQSNDPTEHLIFKSSNSNGGKQ